MNLYDNSVRLLAGAFSDEFAEFCAGHEDMHTMMMELAEEFIDQHTPIVRDDAKIDVAAELIMGVTVRPV